MTNHRPGVPQGWTWRDGRPRWIPSPGLRALGWKGGDLKDARGGWLTLGPSIDRAAVIARAVTDWRADQPVPAEALAFAPPGAADRPVRPDPRSIGFLLDVFMGDPRRGLEPCREFAASRAQVNRRSALNRFVDVLAGYAVQPPRDTTAEERARYDAARERIRAASVYTLEPPPFDPARVDDPEPDLLYEVYWTAHEKIGVHAAAGILKEVSTWLEWCRKRRRVIPANWAGYVDRQTPPGRIRVISWDELALLIEAAEGLGLHSIADSIILGVDLSWSQGDRLPLTWAQISADGRVKATRAKTGIKGETPLLPTLGLRRLPTIRARQAQWFGGANIQPTHVLICETTGRPWEKSHYRHRFAEVRRQAVDLADARATAAAGAGDHAASAHWADLAQSVTTARDQDLRDTAVTVAFDAGLSNIEIASRTLHSFKRIADVLEKHYGQIGQDIADQGAAKLTAHLASKGVRL